jgi:hypothetical protein
VNVMMVLRRSVALANCEVAAGPRQVADEVPTASTYRGKERRRLQKRTQTALWKTVAPPSLGELSGLERIRLASTERRAGNVPTQIIQGGLHEVRSVCLAHSMGATV